MATPTISPILADLSQDIAGAIPVELILLWNTSNKTGKKHLDLLSPHVRRGTVVSSDSAGLSKLSAQRELIDVMQLVSKPKEIIYGYGKQIGGNAIGMWVADNTQMFYDDTIKADDVVEAMIASQHEIKNLTVQVGMGIHHGEFLEIGGGLYGKDANHIEELSENDTDGGSIAVTHTIKKKLAKHFQEKLQAHGDHTKSYLIDYSTHQPSLSKHTETTYPYPFNQDFFEFLKNYEAMSGSERETKLNSFVRNTTVVLMKITHQTQKHLLETLTQYIVANAYTNQLLKEFPEMTVVKSNGDLGIFVTENPQVALEFSKKLQQKLRDNDFVSSVGITSGDVLLFPLQSGFEIAGGPVNLASKLSEDSGEKNKIFIHDSVQLQVQNSTPFLFTISGVEIKGSTV